MDGDIFNSQGKHVAVVRGSLILDGKGLALYTLRGDRIYKMTGELVGHLPSTTVHPRRLSRAADRLFAPFER
jgi:hypothetical protein